MYFVNLSSVLQFPLVHQNPTQIANATSGFVSLGRAHYMIEFRMMGREAARTETDLLSVMVALMKNNQYE